MSAACGPFTDVSDAAFCPFVLEIFMLGVTTGTTATTYSPSGSVTRLQMAAFLSRAVDQGLKRRGVRSALGRFWNSAGGDDLARTPTGNGPVLPCFDGADVWVPNSGSNTVSRVRASDGRLLETWTGPLMAQGTLSAMGRIFVSAHTTPASLCMIDPTQPPGFVTVAATNLGDRAHQIAFDGERFWTGNADSVAIVTPAASLPWTVTTVTAGLVAPEGVVFDGARVWASNLNGGTLVKLDPAGAILQTVTVGAGPRFPRYDGANIWVPNSADGSVTVVRASTGAVLATLTGNGLDSPMAVAFDGERILVTNFSGSGKLSLWKAADLSPIGFAPAPSVSFPFGACSDGVNFWISLFDYGAVARF